MKTSLFTLILLLLPGCKEMNIESYKNSQPPLLLEQYFSGKTQASGILLARNGGLKRQFTVDMQGHWDGKELKLQEYFIFNDGEKQERLWTVKKIDEHHYEGTAPDVVGSAKGEQYGSVLKWSYVLKIPVDGKTYDINFEDWMFLNPDGTLLNRAVMKKFGFKVGELFLSFKKLN